MVDNYCMSFNSDKLKIMRSLSLSYSASTSLVINFATGWITWIIIYMRECWLHRNQNLKDSSTLNWQLWRDNRQFVQQLSKQFSTKDDAQEPVSWISRKSESTLTRSSKFIHSRFIWCGEQIAHKLQQRSLFPLALHQMCTQARCTPALCWSSRCTNHNSPFPLLWHYKLLHPHQINTYSNIFNDGASPFSGREIIYEQTQNPSATLYF